MKRGILQEAISLTQRPSFIFVTTADQSGMPLFITTAGKAEPGEGEGGGDYRFRGNDGPFPSLRFNLQGESEFPNKVCPVLKVS
jgi:hypothetical protein